MGCSDVELSADILGHFPELVSFADVPILDATGAVRVKKKGKDDTSGKHVPPQSGKPSNDQHGDHGDSEHGKHGKHGKHGDDKSPPLLEARHKVGKDGKVAVSAEEQQVRDAHAKIGEHLTRRAMAGQWGPAEVGLQKMHQHLADSLAKHEGHRAIKDTEVQAVGSHNTNVQAHAEQQEALETQAAEEAAEEAANPPPPDIRPAEKLAIENRQKRAKAKAAKAQAAIQAAQSLSGKGGKNSDSEDDKNLPYSVAASRRLAAGAPMLPKDKDDQEGDGKSKSDKFNPAGKGGKPNPFAQGGRPGVPVASPTGAEGLPASSKPNPFAKKGPPAPGGAAPVPGGTPAAPVGNKEPSDGTKPNPFSKKADADTPPTSGGTAPGQPPVPGKAPASGPPSGGPATPGSPSEPPEIGADGQADAKNLEGAAPPVDGQQAGGPSPEELAHYEERKKAIKPPSTEEQANAVLSYKVKLRVSTDDRGDLTTNTNIGGNHSKAEKKLRDALDNLADPRKGRYLPDRKELANVVRKAIGRPATSGELEIADPRRSGKIFIRSNGTLVRVSKEGVWYCPDKFASPEFVPTSGGTMDGDTQKIQEETPPLHEAVHIHEGDFKGHRFYVPIGLESEPLTHQHFLDRHTAKIVGEAKLAKCERSKLTFDAATEEWVVAEHHFGSGWKEVKRYPRKEEGRAERHLRLSLEKHLTKAGFDIGRPSEETPAPPASVSSLHLAGKVLHHAVSSDGSPVGEFHHDRETAVLYAKAISKGVLESRLRHDDDGGIETWILEKSSPDGHGWKVVQTFHGDKPHAAERSFRKALRHDLERAEERPLDGKAVSGDEMDKLISHGHKRARNVVKHGSKRNEVAPAIMRHANGVIQGVLAKFRARYGPLAASAIAATGFKHASHGMGLSRPSKRGGDAHFADDDAGTPDKHRACNWITITGGAMCVGKGGRIVLGPNHLKGRKASDVISHEADMGRVKAAASKYADPEKGWAKKIKSSRPSNSPKEQGGRPTGSRGMHSGGRSSGGRSSGGGGERVGSGGKKKAFGNGAIMSIAAIWKQMITGSATDTTGHGNTAANPQGSWTSRATPGAMAPVAGFSNSEITFAEITFTPTNPRYPKLSRHHIKMLGRLFMEEVRAAMTKASLTRHDLNEAQNNHEQGKSEGWMSSDGKGRVKPKGLRDESGHRRSSELHHRERHSDRHEFSPTAFAAFGRDFSLAGRIRTREGTLPEKDAKVLVGKLETVLSEILLQHTRIRHLEIYPDRVGTQKRADETQGDGVKGVKGFYDRHRELMVTSVVGSDCHNFYHELAHSLDHLLTPEDWERIGAECGGTRPENFARAFADLCMALRAGHGATREFCAKYPGVAGVMHRYSVVEYSHFTAEPESRVFQVYESARTLTSSLRSLTEFEGRSYRELRDLLTEATDRSFVVFDGVFESVEPSYLGIQARIKLRDFVQVAVDFCDDFLHSKLSANTQVGFSAELRAALDSIVPAALDAVTHSVGVLSPQEASREIATAIAFGWQDQVRDEYGRWGSGGGTSGSGTSGSGTEGAASTPAGEGGVSRSTNYFGDEATRNKVKALITATPDTTKLPPKDSLQPLPTPPDISQGPKALAEWTGLVSKHPYVKEAERLIQSARDSGATTGNLYWNPDSNDGRGDFTPERKAIHDEITGHMLNSNAVAKPGEVPQISFVIGPPGSGKTSMGRPAAMAAMGFSSERVTTLDPDEVKMSLPEYRGWNASLVHDESAEVFDRILEKAVKDRHHICFDTTGRDYEFMNSMVDKFADAGYDVHLVHTHLSGEESALRAVNRFVKTAFQDSPDPEQRGRYVPVNFIATHIDGKPEKVYDQLSQDDRIRSWVSYDAKNLSNGIIRNSGTRSKRNANEIKDGGKLSD